MRTRWVAVLAVLAAGCTKSDDKSSAGKPSDEERPGKTPLGIRPEQWRCDSVASDADLTAALGGPARIMDGAFTPERGMARPCNYKVTLGAGDAGIEEDWFFDLDCRPDNDRRAQMLFDEYVKTSAELVAGYKAEIGSGKPPVNDAGVATRAPVDAFVVEVGRKGLDHHGQAILFLDDDAPCHVRVAGPDAARRLALAQLINKNLREAIAPMPPHADPVMK